MKKGLSILPKSWIKKYVFRPPTPASYTFEYQEGKYQFIQIIRGKKRLVINLDLMINAHILKNETQCVPLIHLLGLQKSRTEGSLSSESLGDSKSVKMSKEKITIRTKKLVIFSHGNASDLGDVYYFGQRLCCEYGFDFIAYDYTGYGLGLGQYKCTEEQTYNDLQAVLSFAVHKLNYNLNQIILWGFSLGSGPATEIATRFSGLAGLVLQAPLASIYNWFGEGQYGSQDMYQNINKISCVRVPILLVHGDADEIVDQKHSQRLYEKYCKVNGDNGKVWYLTIKNIGHNNLQQVIEDGHGDVGKFISRFLKHQGTGNDERELKLLELCGLNEHLPGQHFYGLNVFGKSKEIQQEHKGRLLSLCTCD